MTSPRAALVILNWNKLAVTLECLESLALLDYPDYEVVVVDNGSRDESVAVIRERFPAVALLECGENRGFTGGNNVGIRHALAHGADYVLLLNNDTEVAADFLLRLVDAAESDPLIGVAGPTVYYYAQPDVIWSAGGIIDWQRGVTSMVGVDQRDEGQYGEEPREVDFVTGCALLIRRAAIERAGMLDERFFLYHEESEWCVRVARAGYRLVHVPLAKVWHKIAPSARAASPMAHYYMTRNRLLFLRATGAPPSTWIHTLLFDNARTLLSWSLKPKWRHMRGQRDVMIRAIYDFWRGRVGKADVV